MLVEDVARLVYGGPRRGGACRRGVEGVGLLMLPPWLRGLLGDFFVQCWIGVLVARFSRM